MSCTIQCGHWKASKRGRSLGRHKNPGLELVLVLNGSAAWDFEGRHIEAPSRHITFTWPWQWHGAVNGDVPSSELYWVILPFRRVPRSRKSTLELIPELGLSSEENGRLMKRLLARHDPIVKVSRPTCAFFSKGVERLMADVFQLSLSSRALLLSVLADMIEQMDLPQPEPQINARGRVVEFIQQLPDQCEEHWPLERMAATCGIGRTHFTRWLKELTGDTPVQFLNRTRVDRASTLLEQENVRVIDVALACGFQSSQYFATVYRTFKGYPPSQTRAAN